MIGFTIENIKLSTGRIQKEVWTLLLSYFDDVMINDEKISNPCFSFVYLVSNKLLNHFHLVLIDLKFQFCAGAKTCVWNTFGMNSSKCAKHKVRISVWIWLLPKWCEFLWVTLLLACDSTRDLKNLTFCVNFGGFFTPFTSSYTCAY